MKKIFSYFNPEKHLPYKTKENLRQLIPDANAYILTALSTINKSHTYCAHSVPKGKGTGIPHKYNKPVISLHDMLNCIVNFVRYPGSNYAHWLGLENHTLLYDEIDGLVLLTLKGYRYPITLLKPYDQATINDLYIDGPLVPCGQPILDIIKEINWINYLDTTLP
jgi:hypothetical protein